MKAKMTLEQLQRIELMGNVCSTDPARPILTAQYWHPADGEIGMTVAGTDSYKLAQTTIEGLECEGDALVPAVDVTKVSQIFVWSARRHHGAHPSVLDVEVYTSEKEALFALRDENKRLASVRIRLVTGTFPKYQSIIDGAEKPASDDEPHASFNPYHLTGLMKTVPTGVHPIELQFKGALKPMLAKSPADKRWTGLIMPVRTA